MGCPLEQLVQAFVYSVLPASMKVQVQPLELGPLLVAVGAVSVPPLVSSISLVLDSSLFPSSCLCPLSLAMDDAGTWATAGIGYDLVLDLAAMLCKRHCSRLQLPANGLHSCDSGLHVCRSSHGTMHTSSLHSVSHFPPSQIGSGD